jgi:hypothetical protein
LSWKPAGVNAYGYQRRVPTAFDKFIGDYALKSWKAAPESDRLRYAADLVFGKTLVGMPLKSVEYYLGEHATPNSGDPYYSNSCLFFASQFDLCLVVKENRVIDSYLNVNF